MALVEQYRHDVYFESAAMILTLVTVGKFLEARSKDKTADALKSLMKMAPQTAVVVRDGQEMEIGVESVVVGDIVVVKTRLENSGGRHCDRGKFGGGRVRHHGREYAGGKTAGRHGDGRDHERQRFIPVPCGKSRGRTPRFRRL